MKRKKEASSMKNLGFATVVASGLVAAVLGLAAPADAAPEVLASATWKLETGGGRGAFREVVERLLRERGDWEPLVQEFGSGRTEAQSV